MQLLKSIYIHPKLPLLLPTLIIILATSSCSKGQQAPQASGPSEVAVVTVQPQKLELTTELPGRTSPYLVSEIRPQVNGIIKARLFTEGSRVKAGQALYQIDSAPFQATLDSAKANLAKAQANLIATRLRFERFKALLNEKAVSQQDYDDKEAALKQSEAEVEYWKSSVETARINLNYTSVTAPISGRIGKSSVTDGALVTAYQPIALATIQKLDPIYVDVPQSTTELLRLRRRLEDNRLNRDGLNDQNARLLLEDGTPYSSKGTVLFRDVTVDPTTGSVVLRIVFPNPERLLLPGMFVRAVITEGTDEQAILVPQQAVSRDPKGNPFALIVNAEGKIQQRPLTLDRAIGDKWLVSSGLNTGDQVVVEGNQKVRPGVAVKAVQAETSKKADLEPVNTAQTTPKSN
jgi:membrane fusion protein (multidrug efflux system)